MGLWCSGLTRLPVTEEIAGSNPVRPATYELKPRRSSYWRKARALSGQPRHVLTKIHKYAIVFVVLVTKTKMEKDKPTTKESPEQLKKVDETVATLATAFHENRRKARLQEDGSFEPRVKPTTDEAWVAAHGTSEVDIANTDYLDLPEDWQAENKAAASVIVDLMSERGQKIDLVDPTVRSEVGAVIHDAWLSRNQWAAGGELDVPFDDLPEAEQIKDLDQVLVAQEIFSS